MTEKMPKKSSKDIQRCSGFVPKSTDLSNDDDDDDDMMLMRTCVLMLLLLELYF